MRINSFTQQQIRKMARRALRANTLRVGMEDLSTGRRIMVERPFSYSPTKYGTWHFEKGDIYEVVSVYPAPRPKGYVVAKAITGGNRGVKMEIDFTSLLKYFDLLV